MAKYKYQILSLDLLPNDAYTRISSRRTKDDLPAHVRGIAKFHRLGGIATGYYLPQHISVNKNLNPLNSSTTRGSAWTFTPRKRDILRAPVSKSLLIISSDSDIGVSLIHNTLISNQSKHQQHPVADIVHLQARTPRTNRRLPTIPQKALASNSHQPSLSNTTSKRPKRRTINHQKRIQITQKTHPTIRQPITWQATEETEEP